MLALWEMMGLRRDRVAETVYMSWMGSLDPANLGGRDDHWMVNNYMRRRVPIIERNCQLD